MSRPYPTKNAALLDSFLEHKIENERLRKKIEQLKQEELEEQEEYNRQWSKQQEGSSLEQASEDADRSMDQPLNTTSFGTNPDMLAMPPPAKPSTIDTALTRKNLEEASANNKPDSMADKMARYEAANAANRYDTIEKWTGLRYGESSHGISTGDASPQLVRGDVGIVVPMDREGRDNKKKKIKVADEFVCTDCGTLDSPEWRKGPSGPKTLCNACGLRWAKKEKKRSGPSPLAGNMSTTPVSSCLRPI